MGLLNADMKRVVEGQRLGFVATARRLSHRARAGHLRRRTPRLAAARLRERPTVRLRKLGEFAK